ncbi:MAG: hypothetical protein ACPIOQ_54630, partial [Promethearchaeia archaeon]
GPGMVSPGCLPDGLGAFRTSAFQTNLAAKRGTSTSAACVGSPKRAIFVRDSAQEAGRQTGQRGSS